MKNEDEKDKKKKKAFKGAKMDMQRNEIVLNMFKIYQHYIKST